jgi:protein-S-isoprenylcysteine O-methyltransferase Ste14
MTADALALRRAVGCASAAIYWAGVYVQIVRVRRRAGKLPNIKPRGFKERLLWLGWFSVIALWAGQPAVVSAVDAAPPANIMMPLLSPATLVAGLALVCLGLFGTYWCYAAMGASWRIGVKKGEKTALVTSGPYAFIRHPIYAFQAVILFGTFFLLPTPLSVAIIALQLVCAHVKAFDEEAYLVDTHGRPYADYLAGTGRFLPRVFGRKPRG